MGLLRENNEGPDWMMKSIVWMDATIELDVSQDLDSAAQPVPEMQDMDWAKIIASIPHLLSKCT